MYLMMNIIYYGSTCGLYTSVYEVLLKLVGFTDKYTFDLFTRIMCVVITLK